VTKIGERGPGRGGVVYCEVEGVASEVSAENLRQEGLFIPTPEPLPLDKEVDLFLRSEAGAIELRGLVVQVIDCAEATAQRRSPGFGVLFLNLKDPQRAWIARTRSASEPQRRVSSQAQTQPLSKPPVQTAPVQTSPTSTRGAQPRAPAAVTPTPTASTPSTKTSTSKLSVDDAIERARASRKTGTTTLRTSARAQLEAQLATLKARSPSEILGLSAPHTVDAAQQAFLALAKRFHPHVFARLDSPEITRLATEIFIVYKRAYDAIRAGTKDGASSKSAADNPRITLSGTRAPVSSSMRPGASSMRPADSTVVKGAQPTSSMRPVAAAGPTTPRAPTSSLRPVPAPATPSRAPGPRPSMAPNADPTTRRIADAELLLSSAVRHLAATRFEQADLDLAKAATLAPERVDIAVWRYLSRARGHKAGGRHQEARSSYRKVLELDPQHREARENVDPPERRRGGLMSKWLGGDDD
jgi:tetratricopeptide (TPR) repeat protein